MAAVPQSFTRGPLLGGGGFGRIFAATRREDGAACVLKCPLDGASRENIERFRREVRIQANLSHRNIVPIWNYYVDSDAPYFIMPRATESLRERLEHGEFGPSSLFIIKDVARGLDYAHRQGVIHRDVTPENMLLFKDATGLYGAIADFGHGRRLDRDTPALTHTRQRMGKEGYVSPEQYQNAKHVDQRSDIYALGCVLGEILTGKHPRAFVEDELPQDYAYVVHKARRHNPADRFQTVADFLKAVEDAEHGSGDIDHPSLLLRKLETTLDGAPSLTASNARRLAGMLINHAQDEHVLRGRLPRMSTTLLRALFIHEREALEHLFETYDRSISGELHPWYVDLVAGFYERVFKAGTSRVIQIRIMERLPQLARYDRPHVGEVLARLVNVARDNAALMSLRDGLMRDPKAAAWCAPYLRDCRLPSGIREFIQGSTASELGSTPQQ
ncbi:serine/threonine protein kinase [Corallococcus carmarthensis]|uniref:serine/threonine protein kinase n=1 Tax=Corallococcus carmarthensis TaxID=2316728 RepID=UPI00148C8B01|nr:serine/threonine-protein kinase [Corallococcus carmarthensis]NOK17486.1 serine/threonine protein kinase [Corallococcus carmarthensis]